jgi:hypothetical protein
LRVWLPAISKARRSHVASICAKQRKFGQSVEILAAMIPSQDPKMPAG